MPSKAFHISDVLSITTEMLVSTRHIDGVYDILNHMTGESLFTHQLPRAQRVAAPALLAAHPKLAAFSKERFLALADTSEGRVKRIPEFLADAARECGETIDVEPLTAGAYDVQNPLQELVEMRSAQ